MKNRFFNISLFFMLLPGLNFTFSKSYFPNEPLEKENRIHSSEDTLTLLSDLMNELSLNSSNEYFKNHCVSILQVIESYPITAYEESFLKQLYIAFSDTGVLWNASELTSYLERKRPFIISWISPADGAVSLAWILLPENWNPEQTYPLYVTLHGLYAPYGNPIEYMARYLSPEPIIDKSFEDGYSIFPWGRGNLWYEGISETDVWESIIEIEKWFEINQSKKFLVGHSMGGYGAWAIGQKSTSVWAGLGIYAGALWYGGNKYLNEAAAEKLKEMPVYIVCGNRDDLLGNNQTAYELLQDAGDTNIAFVTFNGGHESLLENWQNMYSWLKNFSNENPSSVKKDQGLLQFELYQNYPNPFNPVTNFGFRIPALPAGRSDFGFVTLKVYDVIGNEVAVLVNEEKEPGEYKIQFNAANLSSGVYFYKLTAGEYSQTKKMILMR
ncbi:MAG: T9SS type A sorting domain-containing protein [Ignavibacteria bacterium]